MKTANTEIVKNNANNWYYSLNIQKNPTKVTEQALLGVPQKLYARVISGYWKLFPHVTYSLHRFEEGVQVYSRHAILAFKAVSNGTVRVRCQLGCWLVVPGIFSWVVSPNPSSNCTICNLAGVVAKNC